MEKPNIGLLMVASFVVVLVLEIAGGMHSRRPSSKRDAFLSTVAGLVTAFVWPPLVAILVGMGLNALSPSSANGLASVPFWMIFPPWFLAVELSQYWTHRKAHEWSWLWKVHRTHHSAQHLNVAVIFRNNIFYPLILPPAWFGAAAIHLGLVEVFLVCTLTDWILNLLTHTSYRWDLALRKLPGMNAVFNVLEKVVTLPDAHHAHHGLGKQAHVNGNYAGTLFLFDVLWGTARLPHAAQERFGFPVKFDWREELIWPFFKAKPQPQPRAQTQSVPGP